MNPQNKHLLDTQSFIWWDNDHAKLPSHIMAICEDAETTLYLSMASLWEMQIKLRLGKLVLPLSLPDTIEAQVKNGLRLLPIKPSHIYKIATLADHHRDPFDRLLIAQSFIENIPIISSDSLFSRYGVDVIW